jgi:hypothetical protein
MKYESRADLLIAAGESIKMQEEAEINPVVKFEGDVYILEGFKFDTFDWEFPLAVVEGKPVFVGDELYCTDSECAVCKRNGTTKYIAGGEFDSGYYQAASLNPPKPKTVMVELPRAVAERITCRFTDRSRGVDQDAGGGGD